MKPTRTARDIMSSPALAVGPETEVSVVHALMVDTGCRHLPIVEHGELIGIISDRDVLLASRRGMTGVLAPDTAVAEIMTPHPITCCPTSPVADLAVIMIDQKIDALPVLDEGGDVIGIVTSTDLLGLLAAPIDKARAFTLDRVAQACNRLSA